MKKITPELEKHYEALSDMEQDILKVLAVVYESLSYAEACTVLKAAKLFREKYGIIKQKDLKKTKEKLTKLGFFCNTAKLEVTEEWSYRLLKEVKKEPYFSDLVNYIREELYVPLWYYDNKNKWKRHVRDLRIALITNNGYQ